ncbi:DUF3574 domain-containing protein [Streptomyces sp. SID5470]|uniref:Choline dehydrogenase n=1 Tax=Streptomyces sviceus (strain ATCC 29083 / DSM 924 / JCM 4929 / NBRC 13980 / NCIMB 11184 / NRRL 5439 / UC 5370) TaxID=463191 RepID=B5I325_STRX2|nr:choline dehydrogenase [Streptomyces sviceus ATCC 29083]MYT04792.1 DUF3574 domain-containing protein [Streptomyces sp. SID5470]
MPERGAPYVGTQPFFGTERPGGGPAITGQQFRAFVAKEVTPGFPDGLTVQSGRGQWRDVSGRIEKTFGQEAVARVDERARVDF